MGGRDEGSSAGAEPRKFAQGREDLRSQAKVRAATLLERIGALCAAGRVVKIDGGYRLADR